MILACDVGGTKVRMAIYSHRTGTLQRHQTETYSSSDHSGLNEIIAVFLNRYDVSIERACFGVPGPVVNGAAQTTNLPWKISEAQLSKSLGISKVKLMNDLAVTTAAVPHLSDADILTLHPGEPTKSDPKLFVVVAPGTGLGQGILYMDSGHEHVLPSEGGHVDFAPTNALEIELFNYLNKQFKHVSYERVLSGPGLVNIYQFLKEEKGYAEPAELSRRVREEDAAAVISQTGQSGEYQICAKALDMFVSILGAQAGNLVLTVMATAGVYLGGGIPPKICEKLQDGTVVKSFLNKGRLSYLVEQTPLQVIRDDYAALLGAASVASKL